MNLKQFSSQLSVSIAISMSIHLRRNFIPENSDLLSNIKRDKLFITLKLYDAPITWFEIALLYTSWFWPIQFIWIEQFIGLIAIRPVSQKENWVHWKHANIDLIFLRPYHDFSVDLNGFSHLTWTPFNLSNKHFGFVFTLSD